MKLACYSPKKWTLQKAYLDSLENQSNSAEIISLVSPSEVFRLICGILCRTDVASHQQFMDRVRDYRDEFIDFYKEKKLFSSFIYFTRYPPEKLMTADEIVRIRSGGELQNFKEYIEWSNAHGGSWEIIGKVGIPGTSHQDYPLLDLSDVPRFQWQSTDISADLKKSLSKLAALIIISIVLFYLSFLSFVKYDVR